MAAHAAAGGGTRRAAIKARTAAEHARHDTVVGHARIYEYMWHLGTNVSRQKLSNLQ